MLMLAESSNTAQVQSAAGLIRRQTAERSATSTDVKFDPM